jgi:Na+/H+ antiporter NhaC
MKWAIYCALISAVIGFVVAAFLFIDSQSSGPSWMSPTIVYILCPPCVVSGISVTDPDAESIWLFFGPLNALIYGAVGFTLWMYVVGDRDDSTPSKPESTDRPLGL